MTYQGFRTRALCKIVVDGEDVTKAFDPHLISLQVTTTSDATRRTAPQIELDDRDGRLAIPPDEAPVEVSLGWSNESLGVVFTGQMEEIESGFSRKGGGRRLWLEAKGFDAGGLGRAHFQQSWGDGQGEEISLEDVLKKSAEMAGGIQMKVSPTMRDIKRKYWAQDESFHHLGMRLARELGGLFKVTGQTATFVNMTDGINADGEEMGTVEAVWGENMIGWRIKPFVARPQAQTAAASHFDRALGAWGEIEKAIGGDLPFGRSAAIAGLPGRGAQQADRRAMDGRPHRNEHPQARHGLRDVERRAGGAALWAGERQGRSRRRRWPIFDRGSRASLFAQRLLNSRQRQQSASRPPTRSSMARSGAG